MICFTLCFPVQLRVLDRVADVGILEMRFSLEHVRPKVSCSYRLYGCMAVGPSCKKLRAQHELPSSLWSLLF